MSSVKKTRQDSTGLYIEPPARDIPGVKFEAALGIQKMLEDGRRYFGSSGASLTHQINNPDSVGSDISPVLAQKGLEGERSTTKILHEWMKDKPNVVLVDSVHIHTEAAPSDVEDKPEELDEDEGVVDGKDTDHILLIGDEVILIDTKKWKGKRTYEVGDDGKVLRAKKNFPGGTVRMGGAIYMWLNYLYQGAALTGIVFINAEDVHVIRNKNWYKSVPYRLVELDRFVELLDSRWEKIDEDNKNKINTTLVSQVALSAVAPYDAYKRIFNTSSLANFS